MDVDGAGVANGPIKPNASVAAAAWDDAWQPRPGGAQAQRGRFFAPPTRLIDVGRVDSSPRYVAGDEAQDTGHGSLHVIMSKYMYERACIRTRPICRDSCTSVKLRGVCGS